jgi:DNA-binding MarR family transcriptional regulator
MRTDIDIAACTDCHCLAARRHAREITRIYENHLRPFGLRATQFSVLVALEVSGGAPLQPLAEELGVERTTLTRSAAVMEQKGWVRSAASDDAREHLLELTRAGRNKLVSAYPAWKAAQDEVADMQVLAGERVHSKQNRSPK